MSRVRGTGTGPVVIGGELLVVTPSWGTVVVVLVEEGRKVGCTNVLFVGVVFGWVVIVSSLFNSVIIYVKLVIFHLIYITHYINN